MPRRFYLTRGADRSIRLSPGLCYRGMAARNGITGRLPGLCRSADRGQVRWQDVAQLLWDDVAGTGCFGSLRYCSRESSCLLPSRVRLRLRSEEHTSELQSLMRISYAVFCLKKKNRNAINSKNHTL